MNWNNYFCSLKDKLNRLKLKNHSFSIISSNCTGAFITHDLREQFRSPFVNLYLLPKDFIKFCKNMKYYLELPLNFTTEEGIDFPIGVLDDIRVYFTHYKSQEDAEQKWNTRKQRINFDNLFFIFSNRDGCTYEDLAEFDALPYKNKVAFTNKKYPELKSCFYIKGFDNQETVGQLYPFTSKYFGRKGYDQFKYVKWLNKGLKNK